MKKAFSFLFIAFVLVCQSAMSVTHFELPRMNGEGPNSSTYQSNQYEGAVYVIEAFFLGCPYCNDNAPKVNSLQQYFKNDERVQILDVGIDKANSSYTEWIRRHNPTHPVLKDANKVLIRQLGTSVYPSTYVLDKQLKVVFKTTGVWNAKVESQIRDAVERALKD